MTCSLAQGDQGDREQGPLPDAPRESLRLVWGRASRARVLLIRSPDAASAQRFIKPLGKHLHSTKATLRGL